MKRYIYIILVLALGWINTATAQEAADSLATAAEAEMPAQEAANVADGESAEELWDRANTAYINGDYNTAEKIYLALADRGLSSSKLYYNTANCYFKQGDTGRAILYYHRALRLAPGNPDIRYNLSVAEARTKDNIERIPEFFFTEWLRSLRQMMGCTAWSIISLVMLVCALSLFLLFLLSQRLPLRKLGFYGTLVTALCFVVTTWFAAGERRDILDRNNAVVMSNSAAVKSSPDKAATDLFMLHEGTIVKISDSLEDWSEVTIADGKKGWIESRAIEVI